MLFGLCRFISFCLAEVAQRTCFAIRVQYKKKSLDLSTVIYCAILS